MLPVLEFQPSITVPSHRVQTVNISGPEPGIWYMVAGFTELDPAGLQPGCGADLSVMAEYTLEPDIVTIIPTFNNFQDIRTFYTVNTSQTFSLWVPVGAVGGRVEITKCSQRGTSLAAGRRPASCPVRLLEAPQRIPSPDSAGVGGLDCSALPPSGCSLQFSTFQGAAHYIRVSSVTTNTTTAHTVQFAISVELEGCQQSRTAPGPALLVNSINTSLLCGEPGLRPVSVLFRPGGTGRCKEPPLLLARHRDPRGGSQFVAPGNNSASAPLRLSGRAPTLLQFSTGPADSAGSLAVEVALLRQGRGTAVHGCLARGYTTIPTYNASSRQHECRHGRVIHQASRATTSGPVYEQVWQLSFFQFEFRSKTLLCF